MRILIYGINYHPELTGTGKNTGMMAEWLAAHGHDVRMVAAPPFYPDWQVGAGYRSWTYRREIRNGVSIWRCPAWIPTRPSGITRLLHLTSFAASSAGVVLAHACWRPQVIMSVAPPLLAAPSALLAARLCGAATWLNVKDFEVEAAFDLGLLSGATARNLALTAERWILRRYDRVSSISHAMVARLRAKGVARDRALYFPNWVELDSICPDAAARASMREQLQVAPGEVLALYSGNLGAKQGLEIIPRAAARLHNQPQIVFLVCGEGAGKPALLEAARDLPNLRIAPLQPPERLNALLNAADIHLLPQRQAAADLVLPGKLLYMLACGGAILATADPATDVGRLVQAGGGTLVPAGDAESLAQAVARLAHSPEQRASAARAARAYAISHLGKDAVLVGLQSALETLCAAAPARTRAAASSGDAAQPFE